MEVRLEPATVLPEDADSAVLVGRLHDPEVDGPVLVSVRGDELVDITTVEHPTMSHLLDSGDAVEVARGGRPEVMSEFPERRLRGAEAELLERLPDLQVKPRAPRQRQAVVERRADQGVHERVAPDARLLDHVSMDRLIEQLDRVVARRRRKPLEYLELEIASDHRRRREQIANRPGEPAKASFHRLAHALRHTGDERRLVVGG